MKSTEQEMHQIRLNITIFWPPQDSKTKPIYIYTDSLIETRRHLLCIHLKQNLISFRPNIQMLHATSCHTHIEYEYHFSASKFIQFFDFIVRIICFIPCHVLANCRLRFEMRPAPGATRHRAYFMHQNLN